MNAQTILIVDDDHEIREGLRILLTGESYNIIEADCGAQALEKLSCAVDLVILDVMMPGLSGLRVCEEIRKTSSVPILFLTAKAQESDKLIGLTAGGDDYLTKPFGVMELISRVKALLRRCEGMEDEKFYSVGSLLLDIEKHSVSVNDEPVELTYKEYEFLKMLLENVGIVLKRESIMSRIWGTDYMGETRTVDMHIKTLRQKLGEAGNHIKTVRNVGYMIE